MADAYGFVPISKFEKTEDGTLIVEGPATDSNIDRDRQIADPKWLAKSMPKWFSEGGNIREQHDGKRAVGTAVHYEQRTGGQHWIKAEVVDPVAITKVEKKVLRGFSFGARNARVEVDKAASGGRIVDGDIFEVSLVDRPANPNCMFTVAKADGAGELQPVEEPELVEKAEPTFTPTQFAELLKGLGKTPAAPAETVEKRDYSKDERDEAAKSGAAMKDGSFPIKNATDLKNAIGLVGNAKDPAAAKKHVIKRARALGLVDKLPDSWNVSKALGVLDQVHTLLPDLVLTKDDGATEEIQDVTDGKAAIAAIARLIISEATALAEGRMEEIWDIQTLVNAACSLQCFVDSETWQEAALTMPKADNETTPTEGAPTGEQPAVTKTEDGTPPADADALTKSDLSDLLADAITKATTPLKDELTLVKGELAKVLGTPQSGGPARTRTTTQTAVAAKADSLHREISLCQQSIAVTGGDMQKGYRERLAKAEAELLKLDGAV